MLINPLLLFGAQFDFTISFGNILTITSFFLGAIVAWVKNDNRIKVIENWIFDRKRSDDLSLSVIVDLKVAMAALTAAIKAQTDRLDRVEDKVDDVKGTVTEQRSKRREGDGG